MFLTNLGVVLRQTSFLGIFGPSRPGGIFGPSRPGPARSQMAEISNTGQNHNKPNFNHIHEFIEYDGLSKPFSRNNVKHKYRFRRITFSLIKIANLLTKCVMGILFLNVHSDDISVTFES